MPWINKPPKKERKKQQLTETEERALRTKLYATAAWRKCRKAHLVKEPLCQECLRNGIINAGSKEAPLQVHHKRSPFQNGSINWELALDDKNLETICGECHGKIHAKERGYVDPQDIIKALEDFFAEVEDGN